MINARSETAAALPAFREVLKLRRCLIPADGSYEWKRTGTNKQPYCFEVNEGELFAFAGLWDRWQAPDGKLFETCTIMTTTANQTLAGIHDRMPVILAPEHYDLWLDPRVQTPSAVESSLTPFDAGSMRSYPVSTRVNTVVNDDPECSAPIQLVAETLNLFD